MRYKVCVKGEFMERLTHKSRSEAGYKANRGVSLRECLDKLGHLGDLQEQGMVMVLSYDTGLK